ncbi:MAG: SAM-dependent chlorinase/fluorinase [Crocinitomicaceae bacterium]|nr:SAM-dependent chlorinase/fluorinase [Crocinitomicaceae bacterium]
MSVITLTTDMGLNDHYVASLKGTILKSQKDVHIIDISHAVKPFDISEAAFLLSSCYKDFPEGTVHIIGVDSEPIVNFGGTDGSFPSILIYKKQYFICNDNGFFGSFLKEEAPDSFWRIDDVLSNPNLFQFPTKNLLLTAGLLLLKGDKIENIASPFEGYKKAFTPMAIMETNLIKGYIIHIDNFGNAITNIHKSLFARFGKDIPFILYFKKEDYYIDVISSSYNEVPQGEKVAIFNENGYLEIAINRGANGSTGGAQQLFGLHTHDMVRIEFTPQGSRQTIDSFFT